MKKHLSILFALLLTALILCAVAFVVRAHPGRTDGGGGHIDHDSGEYHYHHGYPAHSHYDMDGDGDIDCPYDFDDKTDHNSDGDSLHSSENITENTAGDAENILTEENEELKKVPAWVYWIISVLALSFAVILIIVLSKNKEIKRLRITELEIRKKDKQIVQLNDKISNYDTKLLQLNRTILSLNEQLEKIKAEDKVPVSVMNDRISELQIICQEKSTANILLREENEILRCDAANLAATLSRIKGNPLSAEIQERYGINPEDLTIIPEDIYFINGIIPVSGIISDRRPYGDLTLYMAERGRCYHADYYCGNGFLLAVHAYDVIGTKRPCRICGYRFPVNNPPEWYISYRQLIDKHTGAMRYSDYDERPKDIWFDEWPPPTSE